MIKLSLNKKNELIQKTEKLFNDLFPICRSITGDGLRKTLHILQNNASFSLNKFNTGEKHYDWTIPNEWKIKDAYVKDFSGKKIIDFKENNLHVVNYSSPINTKINFNELKKHLHSIPNLPDAIPYRTSYYHDEWGFCLSHNQLKNLDKNQEYEVLIDSYLEKGELNYGEQIIGSDNRENYIVTTYPCHPSLANDNLSGIILWTLLLNELQSMNLKNKYTFVIHPETIGAIAYISRNEEKIKQMDGGFVVTTVAGPGKHSLKYSFSEISNVDKAAELSLKESGVDYITYKFDPDGGSDERQYSSPYFKVPMVSICKDKYFEYNYYHTSFDNLGFISSEKLIDTLELYLNSIDKLEKNLICKSLNPKCEPMLGKRNLYPKIGGQLKQLGSKDSPNEDQWSIKLKAINHLMYMSDGKNSLLNISEKTGIEFDIIHETAISLIKNKLLKEA